MEGGPRRVGGYYDVGHGKLTSLKGLAESIGYNSSGDEDGYLLLANNPGLTSLEGINRLKKIYGVICALGCPIRSHLLGVLYVEGITRLQLLDDENEQPLKIAENIVNRWIKKEPKRTHRTVIACQSEMLDFTEHDLSEFARL